MPGSSGGPFTAPPAPDTCPTPHFSVEQLGDHCQGLPLPTGEGPYSGHWGDRTPQSPLPGSVLGRAGTGQHLKHTLRGVWGGDPTPPHPSPELPPQQDGPPQSHHQLVPWEALGGVAWALGCLWAPHGGSGDRGWSGRGLVPGTALTGTVYVTDLQLHKFSLYGT